MTQRSLELEQGIVSMLLNHNAAADDVADILKPEHFADQFCRALFCEITSQIGKGQACDVLTVYDTLQTRFSLADIQAVRESHSHAGPRSIKRLAVALVDRHRESLLKGLSFTIAEIADGSEPISERIDMAQAEVAKLADTEDSDEWVDAYTAALAHTAVIEQREEGLITGLSTGLTDLDEMLDGGMARGNVIVLAGRPSMGKTAIAMTIGLHVAEIHAVGFMSLEMPHVEVRDRQISNLGRVPLSTLKRPKKGLEYDRVMDAVERSRTLRFVVSDRTGINILQIRSKARALKRTKGLDVLMIDYLGLITPLDGKMNVTYQIAEITRGLKSLAKELDIVIILLVQVGRYEGDDKKPPVMSNLKDSSAIEADADVIGMVYRPIHANPDIGIEFKDYALLRVVKNRQGRTGDVHCSYQGEFTRFGSWGGPPPSKNSNTKSSKTFQKGDF